MLEQAAELLGSYLSITPAVSWSPRQEGAGPEAAMQIALDGTTREYAVELKIGLRPNNLGAVVHRVKSRKHERTVLIADYVSPPLAERLREQGISYLDVAGNAWLQDPPLMIWVSGRRRDGGFKQPATGRRAFQGTGLRVVFAMLCHPEWCNLPYRELATRTGVAHGSVGHVMNDLTALGYVFKLEGKRRLARRKRLLQQWAEAYPRSLRASISLGRFEPADEQVFERVDPSRYGMLWGSEMAAKRLTGYLRPGTWTLYGDSFDHELLTTWKLRPDPQGRLEVLKRFWQFEPGSANGMVPLPLIYADLLMNGDGRSLETAELIAEQMDAGSV